MDELRESEKYALWFNAASDPERYSANQNYLTGRIQSEGKYYIINIELPPLGVGGCAVYVFPEFCGKITALNVKMVQLKEGGFAYCKDYYSSNVQALKDVEKGLSIEVTSFLKSYYSRQLN